jgi:hypothetical protein
LTFLPPPHVMSFHVVGPDGAPVPYPFVAVTAVGDDGRRTERGGPNGTVAVGVAFAKDPATGLLRAVLGPSGHVLMLTRGGDRCRRRSSSRLAPVTWRWTYDGGGESAEFPSQAEAEAWLGEAWRELLDGGVPAVTLVEDGRTVYGPMPLDAA